MNEHATPTVPHRSVTDLVSPRALAFAGGAVLSLSYLSVLYHVVDVVGGGAGTATFALVVLGSMLLAAACSRAFGFGWAVVLGAALLVAGLAGYLLTVPSGTIELEAQLADFLSLLSGLSVLRVTNAGVWALGLTPAPVFLSWYFFGRRAYAPGVLVGGAALATFVLTGDAETVPALVGVLGGVAAVGFGQLDREGADPDLRNTLVAVLVAMLVVTTSASLVPGGEARPLLPDRGSSTVEASLTGADARVEVLGSITLSPEVRFTVTAPESHYFRVGAYDRYTGDGWVRTGDTRPYDGRLPGPAADDVERVEQTFVAESAVSTMPAAWKPVRVRAAPGPVEVTNLGGLAPRGGLLPGERYTVVSLVPSTPRRELADAGTDYPDAIEERYLGLPESTPERLSRFTSNLTAEADSPYRKAVVIEEWLESTKTYSLVVDRPEGDVASGFVFEMDAGYCTYFATAMVTMLRTQGIPARFVVGYTPGQRVAEDRWVIRGLDSHAWVEVYVPDAGWVTFDPTPAAPRQSAERERLLLARRSDEPNVDTNESLAALSATPPTTRSTTVDGSGTGAGKTVTATGAETPPGAANGTSPGLDRGLNPALFGLLGSATDGAGGGGPSQETLLYGLVLLLGAATALSRLGVLRRLYRALWLRRLPAGPPRERIEAAVERAEYVLGRRYRPRREGETRRRYVEALGARGLSNGGLDERAVALFRLGERARYAGRATEADAADAGRLLQELRDESGVIG